MKKATIVLVEGQTPEISFEGDWRGPEVKMLSGHLTRAYRRYKIQTARELDAQKRLDDEGEKEPLIEGEE